MLNRRKLLRLSASGFGVLLANGMGSAFASLNDAAKRTMIDAIPGPVGRKIKTARHIGYHVTSQPRTSKTLQYLVTMWDRVFTRTDGWLQIFVLPNSAELPAADTEAVLATASGRFDVITVAGPAIDQIMPDVIPLQALAFAYANSQEARSVVNTPLYADCMRDAALKNNLYCLDGLLNAGMRQMTTIPGYPIKSIKNFEDLVLRIPPGPIYAEQLTPLGIKPLMTPISDALMMMKNGTCKGQENPNSYSVLFKFYEVCKYLNTTNHFWSGFNTLINADTWNTWPSDIRKIVQEEYTRMLPMQWSDVESENSNAARLCVQEGMQIIRPDLIGVKQRLKSTQANIVQRLDTRLQSIAQKLIDQT